MAKSTIIGPSIGKRSQSLFARFLRSSNGGIAIGIALASPALLVVVGLAADYAVSTMKVTELQAAADAAAIAGVNELALSGSTEHSVESVVEAYVLAQNTSGISHTTADAKINRKEGTVQVLIYESWTPLFANLLNADVTPIRVNATARLMGKTNICVLGSVEIQGSQIS